jgi:hypothetical protein
MEDAGYNRIGDDGSRHLSKGQWPALQEINLCRHAITKTVTK